MLGIVAEGGGMTRHPRDRAAAVATAVMTLVRTRCDDLTEKVAALLRGEFEDIARVTRDETRPNDE
jgi:hypothetical protein